MYLHQTRHRRSTTKRGCSNQAFNLNLILLGAALLCFSVGEERCSYCNGNPSRIVSSMIPMKRMATMQYDPHPGSVEKEFPLPRPSEPTEIGYQRIYSGELPMAEFTYSVDTNASDSATSALFTGDPLPENPFSYYPGGSISDEGGKLKIPIDSEESIQGADLYKVMDNRHIPRRSPYYNLCYQEMFEDSSDADDDDDDATKTGFVNVTTTAVQRRHLIDRKHYLEQNKRNFEEIKQIAFIRKLNESQMKFLTNTYLRHFALGYDALTSKSTQILTARLKLSTSQLENCTAFYKKQYEYLLMALGDDNDMGSSISKKSKEKGDHDQLHQIQTIEQGIGQGEIADITHQGKQQKKREDEKEEEEKQKNDHSSSAGGGGETLADALISRAGGNLDLEPPPPPQGANLSDIKVLKKYYSLESSSMENDDYLQTGYRTYDDKFHGLFPSPTACAHEVEQEQRYDLVEYGEGGFPIILFHLAWYTTDEQVFRICTEAGAIVVDMKFNEFPINGMSKGSCIVWLKEKNTLNKVIKALNGRYVDGRQIGCKVYNPDGDYIASEIDPEARGININKLLLQ